MTAAALLLVASGAVGPHQAACAAALDLAYDGSTGTAVARLVELNTATPDLLCAYIELLVRVGQIEQTPGSAALDVDFHRRADALIARADERLRSEPHDTQARFVRGATYGVRSRLHLFRIERRAAISTAVAMRKDLLLVAQGNPFWDEAQFGLGLYDYYADVLPRALKLLRFITGLPAGDRERGLARMELARQQATLHHTEAQVQLVDAYVYYERRDDDAYAALLDLRGRYPGSPRWGLMLAEHQRERLGLYAESAATAREIAAAAASRRANYAQVVGGMARVLLAEALLLDLRPSDALSALDAPGHLSDAPNWAARAELVRGEILEQLGQRATALEHYRAAATRGDNSVRPRALEHLREPLADGARRALTLLGEARRLRDVGRDRDALPLYRRALQEWPGSQEAALRVAEDEVAQAQLEAVRRHLSALLQDDAPQPPWVRPWAHLLAGRMEDLAGHRAEALQQYNQVLQQPLGSSALKEWATAGRRQPFNRVSRDENAH